MLDGQCHCGNITAALATARSPSELPVRICGCGFCARVRPLYTSDPSGRLDLRVSDPEALIRYRFGLRLADFLICKTCGVFVAAYEPEGRAVLNLTVLARAAELVSAPTTFTAYDTEDEATRSARRARGWTPATLTLGP